MRQETEMGMKRILTVAVLALAAALSLPVAAAQQAGEVGVVTGRATAADDAGQIRSLDRASPLYEGEIINTGPASYVNLKFSDGGRVLLRPNSRFKIDRFQEPAPAATAAAPGEAAPEEAEEEEEGSAFFSLLKGGFRAVTGLVGSEDRRQYKVRTPVATIGIRGTDYEARYCEGDCLDVDPVPQDGLYAGVNEGGITLTNASGEHVTAAGRFAFVADNASEPVELTTRPRPLAQDPIPDPETCE